MSLEETEIFGEVGTVTEQPFGEVPGFNPADPSDVGSLPATLYTLSRDGYTLAVTDFGATVVKFVVPASSGPLDVVLGYDTAEEYDDLGRQGRPFFGAVVGRVANRIKGGDFVCAGEKYSIPKNDGNNALHGGTRGWDRRLWKMVGVGLDGYSVKFQLLSPDGEMGFGGAVTASVEYALEGMGRLRTEMRAIVRGKATPINMAHHTYWNLAGHGSGKTVDAHTLEVQSNSYTVNDSELIPTGEVKDVRGTPYDFRLGVAVGSRVDQAGGYDNNWTLSRNVCRADEEVARCAHLSCVDTGVSFELCTQAPGVQVYSGNFLPQGKGKGGVEYPKRGGICLETQGWPNAVNTPSFPSTLLRPGEEYVHVMLHSFECGKAAATEADEME